MTVVKEEAVVKVSPVVVPVESLKAWEKQGEAQDFVGIISVVGGKMHGLAFPLTGSEQEDLSGMKLLSRSQEVQYLHYTEGYGKNKVQGVTS